MTLFLGLVLLFTILIALAGYGKSKQTGEPVLATMEKTATATMKTSLWGIVILILVAMVFVFRGLHF